MSDWQAYRFHLTRMWFAFAVAAFGFALVMAPILLGSDAVGTTYAFLYGTTFALLGGLYTFAYAYDGRARRLTDWLFQKVGDGDYPWAAHDVEVTYRNER